MKALDTAKGMSKEELVSAFVSMKQRGSAAAARIREKTEQVTENLVGSLVTTGSGAAVGLLRNKMGSGPDKRVMVPGVNLDLTMWGPIALQALGVAGLGGKANDRLLEAANGASAAHWGIECFLHGLPGEGR